MTERIYLNCKSTEFVETGMIHVLIEQGDVRFGVQSGVEVTPIICKKCGFVMLFKKQITGQ